MDGAVGPPDAPAVHQVPDQHHHHDRHHQSGNGRQYHDGKIPLPHKHVLEWNGEDERPAIAHFTVVDAPLYLIRVLEKGIIGQQRAVPNPSDQGAGKVLELRFGYLPLGGGIEEGPFRIA